MVRKTTNLCHTCVRSVAEALERKRPKRTMACRHEGTPPAKARCLCGGQARHKEFK